MKKRILSSILMLFILLGIQFPTQAEVLIKNGVPQTADVSFSAYKADGWGAYPDYHVQNATPSIWVSQLNTGGNSARNCVPATAKMLLNMNELLKEKSVETLGNEGLREVNNNTMLEYLRPYGYLGKLIMSTQEIKKYLDWGNVVTVPTAVHQRLCIGYATRNDKTWFEVLDPAFEDISHGHQWIEEKNIGIGFAITDTNAVIPFTVNYTDSNGNLKQATAYYNNLDYYLPKYMVNELVPETLINENYFKTSILPTMNYEMKKQNQITNIDKVAKQYMYIGEYIYQPYEFTKDSRLQKENGTVTVNYANAIKSAS